MAYRNGVGKRPFGAMPTYKIYINHQEELDAAYDQAVYAPNHEQVLKRLAADSEKARAVLGEPLRFSYGARASEELDIYPAGIDNSPILIFIHGGTWRFGVAADNAFAAGYFPGCHVVQWHV